MGTLDVLPEQPNAVPQTCRFLKLTAPFTGPNMRGDVNAVLDEGWNFQGIYLIDGENFAVFTRPKRQDG